MMIDLKFPGKMYLKRCSICHENLLTATEQMNQIRGTELTSRLWICLHCKYQAWIIEPVMPIRNLYANGY